MKEKKAASFAESEEHDGDSSVHLTIYDVPESLLRKFCEKIVKPNYSCRVGTAIKDLMRKALEEHDSTQAHVRQVEREGNG